MTEVDVITQTDINCPLERVAAYSSNPNNAPDWYVNIKSVDWKTEPPLVLGSKIAFVAHFLGKRMAYTYEVVTFEEHAHFVMRTAEGPFPMETTYTWEALGDASTRMTLRNRGQPTGFSRLMRPLMTMMMRRANTKDLALLKQRLESDVAPTV